MVRDLFAIPASNTTVERLFSSSKNTVTDRRTSLSGKRGNELLFLQKNLLSLQRIDKDASIRNKEQLKRKISTTNDGKDLLIEGKNNSLSSTMTKRTKQNSDSDYSSNDIDDLTDNSIESDEPLFE
ncbi:unnamed protein product [Rotaria socialis]|uniref:HAT C-terminal dimerisation domain-containing protein n=1 Tax=Rotaria socialis TaxID=392032 RepID=A0A821WLK8_9BILA|nr:unnamed protein product [Rotaria socialis]